MNFMERLEELCAERKISKRTLEKEAGLGTGSTSKWNKDNGKNPNQKSLEKLSKYFDVSIDYLMGQSEFRTKEEWLKHLDGTSNLDEIRNDIEKYQRGIKINVYGYVVAGIPLEAIEDIIDTEEIPESMARQGEHFGLKIKGDSMTPRILEGDVVIVRKQEDAESGDLVIALINGFEATCKKLIKHDDGIQLVSFNNNYEPMYFSNQEILDKPVEIIGKVVELRGKY